MASFGTNLGLVPIILKVKTSEQVTRMCFLNNKLNNQKYNYALPAPFVKGQYEIHFFGDASTWNNPSDLKGDALKFIEGGFR